MSESLKLAILMPCFNTKPWSANFSSKLDHLFGELKNKFNIDTSLVFVDDGSNCKGTDLDSHRENLVALNGVAVFGAKHHLNRGQGAALATALKVAKHYIDADYFVTMDADEQHDPSDILNMLFILVEKDLNIVFGNRFAVERKYLDQIPFVRKFILKMAIKFEKWVTGLSLSDAHNGFRIFDRKAAEVLDIKQDRMAHATEFKILVARNALRYGECPVRISYSGERVRQGQSNSNAINILNELIKERLL